MKKNKPTYITDLTQVILTNTELLNEWAEKSVDMKFLDLSVKILSDIDLLFSWDCNNILNLKLSGILSGNKDFVLKSGMVINIDSSYDFPFESPAEYKKIIKEMIDAKIVMDLQIRDLQNQGHDLDAINEIIRKHKMSHFIQIVEKTKGYRLPEFNFLLKNVLPNLIELKNKWKEQFFNKKATELFILSDDKINEHDNNIKDLSTTDEPRKIADKWYALLYWIQLCANGKLPPSNTEGEFRKKELEIIGRKMTNKSGQGFYRSFITIDLNNSKVLKNSFGDNWQNVIIELSNNDPIVKTYLENKYSS